MPRVLLLPWLVALSLFATADGDGDYNMGERSMFTMLAQLSPIAGNSPSSEVRPSGRGERNDRLPERPEKSVRCGRRYPEWASYRAPRSS